MNDLEKALNVCNAINNDLTEIVENHDLMAIVAKTLSDNGDASIRQLLKFTEDGLPVSDPEKKSLAHILEIEREANKMLNSRFEQCFNILQDIHTHSHLIPSDEELCRAIAKADRFILALEKR